MLEKFYKSLNKFYKLESKLEKKLDITKFKRMTKVVQL